MEVKKTTFMKIPPSDFMSCQFSKVHSLCGVSSTVTGNLRSPFECDICCIRMKFSIRWTSEHNLFIRSCAYTTIQCDIWWFSLLFIYLSVFTFTVQSMHICCVAFRIKIRRFSTFHALGHTVQICRGNV